MSSFRSTGVLLRFIFEMLKNKHKLTEELETNYNVCRDFCNKTIEKSHIDFSVYGKENIPDVGPTLIASNHNSFFDILLLVSAIDRAMPFAAAKELDSYPLLKKYIESINCVLIDRKSEDLQVMKEQIGEINKAIINTGLVLFPEGECSYLEDDIKDFKKGGFVGTINKSVIVVPTYISSPNMDKVFKWYVPTGEVSVTFGKGFIPEMELGTKVKSKQVAEYTKKKVLELKNNR